MKCRFNEDEGGFEIPMTSGLFSINVYSILTQTGKENDREETSRKEGKEQRHHVLLIVTFTHKVKLT